MSSDSDSRRRIIEIMLEMHKRKTFSQTEFVNKYNRSDKAIQIDFKILRENGFDIKKIAGKEDTYTLAETNNCLLDYHAIRKFADKSGTTEAYPYFDDRFIGKYIQGDYDENIKIDPMHYERPNNLTQHTWQRLLRAVDENKQISFTYNNKERDFTNPYKIRQHKGIWYLAAVEKDQLKIFSTTKISSLAIHEEKTFTHNPAIDDKIENSKSIWMGQSCTEVSLLVDKEVAHYFTRRQLLAEQTSLEKLPDGKLRIKCEITHPNSVLPIIRYWAPNVQIEYPQSLKQELLDSVQALVQRMMEDVPG